MPMIDVFISEGALLPDAEALPRYPHLRLAYSSLSMVQRFGALGMPYSVILDTKGREVARVPRALRWDSSEVLTAEVEPVASDR